LSKYTHTHTLSLSLSLSLSLTGHRSADSFDRKALKKALKAEEKRKNEVY
jgi:hypothetical protein